MEKDEEVEDREKRDGAIGEGRIRTGTLSVIGAVSPPGGDLSDPVVQATLKVVKVFWSLEDVLAFERHFPAIGWLTSYSLYHDNLENYFQEKVDERFVSVRLDAMKLLQNEDELNELRRIVGDDSLSPKDRLVMKTAKAIREDFLQQSAFDEIDAYSDLYKQYRMLDVILRLDDAFKKALEKKAKLDELLELQIHDRISKMREIHLDTKGLDEEEKRDFYDREFDDILADIERQVGECCKENQESVSNEG